MKEKQTKNNFGSIFQMPKIKTVYIHGLDSEPVPEKMDIMAQAGFDVSADHINYRENKEIYARQKELILEKNAEYIIGSSLGGMLAYWLGEDIGIPCLLFNPAMEFQSVQIILPQINKLKCPARIVILGEQDDVIDPLKNKQYFYEKQRDGLHQKILSCSWLGHSIDFQTFEEMIFLAARNYSVWKLLNSNV